MDLLATEQNSEQHALGLSSRITGGSARPSSRRWNCKHPRSSALLVGVGAVFGCVPLAEEEGSPVFSRPQVGGVATLTKEQVFPRYMVALPSLAPWLTWWQAEDTKVLIHTHSHTHTDTH